MAKPTLAPVTSPTPLPPPCPYCTYLVCKLVPWGFKVHLKIYRKLQIFFASDCDAACTAVHCSISSTCCRKMWNVEAKFCHVPWPWLGNLFDKCQPQTPRPSCPTLIFFAQTAIQKHILGRPLQIQSIISLISKAYSLQFLNPEGRSKYYLPSSCT